MDKKSKGKITLGMLKGKPITSSVPSIAIRFNATAEEIEELYMSDGEQNNSFGDTAATVSDVEGSPSKFSSTPKFAKRSTSIDVSNTLDASPPTDPWRFLSDIKGKITKSVEGKITEYKSRTVEGEGSPKTGKPNKDGKESSSLSDSEELSESSISKTCGIVSTTEGAEMSSDDETPSLSDKEKEKKAEEESNETPPPVLRKRVTVIKNTRPAKKKQMAVAVEFLENLQKINMGVDDDNDIENGIDALSQIDNIEVDGDDIIVKEIHGKDLRRLYYDENGESMETTVFAPKGHVDLRPKEEIHSLADLLYSFRLYFLLIALLVVYFHIPLSSYLQGFLSGAIIIFTGSVFYIKFFLEVSPLSPPSGIHSLPIIEIPAAKEIEAPSKYEGWVNEYPDRYDPHTYHVSQTQSVYLRLQGNLLKISHTKSKVPKRALWNEVEPKQLFTRHRIYNLLGAKVSLLPNGLTKKRHWSKKYPICVRLNKDQFTYDCFDSKSVKDKGAQDENEKRSKIDEAQVFSKLYEDALENAEAEENEFIKVSNSDGSPNPLPEFIVTDIPKNPIVETEQEHEDSLFDEDDELSIDDVASIQSEEDKEFTSFYIFARTDREKEHWFRRLVAATHNLTSDINLATRVSLAIKSNNMLQSEYFKFMSRFIQPGGSASSDESETTDVPTLANVDVNWISALMTRLIFDLIRNDMFYTKLKERIQRKLSAIKLPYFIEELSVTELSLGNTPPVIKKTSKPMMNEWGLWLDFDISYEGQVTITLQTKLNLMKLKAPPPKEERTYIKSPMFHSDVDDTAESSSEDDAPHIPAVYPVLDAAGNPVPGLGGTSNKSRRFMKMVDRIAESKIFQVATENKYIKRAIEGVSNTDLSLKLEIKCVEGCLVFNIPTPPSDRIWIGFRPVPLVSMSAQPIVGERNINFLYVTNWIEKKVYKEFQKLLVLPNMEDIHIPVMMQLLPE